MPLTAEQIVGIVNSLDLSVEDVAVAFASAKGGVQAKTLQSLIEQAAQKDAALRAAEDEQMQPIYDARSQRANAIAAAQALAAEVVAGRFLSKEELADVQSALEF